MAEYDIGTARGTIELDASSLGRASAAFTSLGVGMTAFGLAAVGAFAYVVKQAADFEKVLSGVQAVSGATVEQMELLRRKALELGGTTVFSASEIAKAMEDLAKAGLTVPEILDGATEATVHLAAAAGDELSGGVSRAAEVIANAMKTFGAGADDMEHFADVMVGAAASSTLSVDDLATSLTYVGPVAHAAGVSFEDLNTMLAILGDRGIKGSMAGTSLRGILLSLTPTSEKATNAMKDLGLITADGTNKFFDMNGALKPIPEVMQLLQEATAGLSEEQKISAFNTIFQRRAMASALVLAEQGAAGFDKYASAIEKLKASDVAAAKLNNLSGDLTILKNALNALIIEVGEPFQETLRGWVQGLTGVVDWLRQLDPQVLSNALAFIAIAGAALTVVGSFLLITGQMIKMYKTAVDLWAGLKIVWTILSAIGSAIVSVVGAPVLIVIAIIAAVIAVFTLLYFKVDAVRKFIDGLWDSFQAGIDILKGWVSNVVGFLQDLWGAFQNGGLGGDAFREVLNRLGGAGDILANVFNTLKDVAMAVGDALVTAWGWVQDNVIPVVVAFGQRVGEIAMDIWGWLNKWLFPVFQALAELVQAVMNRVTEAFDVAWPIIQGVWDKIVQIITWAWGVIQPLIEWYLNTIVAVMKTAWDIITNIVSTALDIIISAWHTFSDVILPIVTQIWNAIYLVIETVWNTIKGIVESALQIIRGIINVITGIISGDWGKVWEGIQNIFGGAWHFMQTIVETTLHFMQQAISIAWETIKAIISGALEVIGFIITSAMAIIQLILDTAWSLIQLAVETVWNFIVAVIQTALNIISSIIETVLNFITSVVTTAWETVKWIFTDGIGAVVSFMQSLPGKILSALGDLLSLLVQKGRDVLQGLWDGITFIWNNLAGWIGGLGGLILDTLGDMGRTLFDVGRKIIQGLWDGMKDIWNSVTGWLGDLGGAIVDLKGPPEKDAKLLIGNGELIMKSLAKGLQNGYAEVEKMLSKVAPTLQSNVGISGSLGTGNSGGATVILDFSNSTFGPGAAEEVKGVVNDPSTLRNLTMAIKAGSRS